jgi:hypothetical protein
MKQWIGGVISEVLYYLGDCVSRPMCHWDWAWIYPVYNWLMDSSHRVQLWAGTDTPWQVKHTEKDAK